MNVLFIVTGLGKASGITTFVENVAAELRKCGHLVDILTKSSPDSERLNLSSYDVVHIHGLWSPWLHTLAKKIRKLRRSPTRPLSLSSKLYPLSSPPTPALYPYTHSPLLVWSPHGMLQKWALKNKFWKKFLALALYQWRDLHSADLLHATAQSEVEDIRRLGLRNRVVIAPLGVRNQEVKVEGVGVQRKVKTLLFVSRVQRKKGLPNLIHAWSRLSKIEAKNEGEGEQGTRRFLTDGWQVRIVGPDEDNHTAELIAMCQRLGLSWAKRSCADRGIPRGVGTQVSPNLAGPEGTCVPEVSFEGPKYDDELAAEYDAADLFVLPTHSENFGSVVIESLAHGVPVITTKEAPWAELEEFKCGWWIDDSVKALVVALKDALTKAVTLPAMGARGRSLVEARYTWSAVCEKLVRGYEGEVRA